MYTSHWWVIVGPDNRFVKRILSDLDEPRIVWVERLQSARAFATRAMARRFIQAWGRYFNKEDQRPRILKLKAVTK